MSLDPVLKEVMTLAVDENPKTRFGKAKPSMANVPPVALVHLMMAHADGVKKYGQMNWRDTNVPATIYYDAAMRHLMKWLDGQELDADSGVHHLGHVMACCAIILDAQASNRLSDDRPTPGEAARIMKLYTREI